MRSTTAVLLALGLALAGAADLAAQAALRAAPSGRATSEVLLQLPPAEGAAAAAPLAIRIDYGQPHLRGRALGTDSLVPFDQPWRTGANAPTTLSTEADLTIGGVAVPRGTYIVYSLPRAAGWELILQRGTTEEEAAQYDPARDFARIPLRRRQLAAPMESLTFWLVPARGPGAARGELRFAWGTEELSADWVVR